MTDPANTIVALVIMGSVLFLFGLFINRHPYIVTRLSEQFDAVGSETELDDVEPTDWNVKWTYRSSYLWMAIGIGMIILAV